MHASAEHETPYGRAAIWWRIAAGELAVEVTLPTGTEGVVELPGEEPRPVSAGTHRFAAKV